MGTSTYIAIMMEPTMTYSHLHVHKHSQIKGNMISLFGIHRVCIRTHLSA